MDVFQSRIQAIFSMPEVQEVDRPRTTGIVQMNTYYQNVLGPIQRLPALTGSAAVSVAGNLIGYLGTASASDPMGFPTSRAALQLHISAPGDVAADLGTVRPVEETMAPLLNPGSAARQTAGQGDWARLAAWQGNAPNVDIRSSTARDLITRTALQGSSEHYRAACPPSRVPPRRACEAPPRALNQSMTTFVDYSDYAWSADARVVCGERSDDVAIKPVADVLKGFSAPIHSIHWARPASGGQA